MSLSTCFALVVQTWIQLPQSMQRSFITSAKPSLILIALAGQLRMQA
jgi:hypothetical protein